MASRLLLREIWGQPRAWTDEKISCDLVAFIREQWGQAIVFADCLGAQWTDAVLLRAWLENIIWAPYAPEVTSTLQEPDTHEHSVKRRAVRKSKWTKKFQGIFAGKSSRRWLRIVRAGEDLTRQA